MATTADEDDQPGQHADGCQRKAHRPAILLLRETAGDGCDDRTDVTRCVHQREAAVATWIGRFVQFAQQAADVGLKQPIAADDNCQRQVEEHRRDFAGAKHHMADDHQQCAEHDRHAVAEHFIRQIATEDGRDVYERTIGAEQFVGVGVVVFQLVGEIQNQQRAHAIEAEVFPDLQSDDVVNRLRLRL